MADGGGGGGRTLATTPTGYTRNAVGNLTRTPTAAPSPNGGLSQQRLASISSLGSTARKVAGRPLALSTTNTWAANNDSTKSATYPQKQDWNSLPSGRPSLTHANSGSSMRSEYVSGPAQARQLGLKAVPSLPSIHYTQTAQYHSNTAPSPLTDVTNGLRYTDPIPQTAWSSHTAANSSSDSASSRFRAVPDTPSSTAPTFVSQQQMQQHDEPTSPGNSSVAISDHYTKTQPEKAGHKGEVWTERAHSRGLRRALKDDLDWVEAYPGALHTLLAMNPEQFQMPYGTRVQNIKTDFPDNIIKAIRLGKVAQMAKNAERTMRLWDARQDAKEKVYMIFSLNGSGRFCGIAEMSGPWDRNDHIRGWESHRSSDPPVGSFPITWLFIKDVAYHNFKPVRQMNGNNIGNMWNGMSFESDVGRKVIELYVKCPATTSIIGHPKNQNEGQALVAYLPPQNQNAFFRGGPSFRGARGGRGGFRGAFNSRQQPANAAANNDHWRARAPSNPYSSTSITNSATNSASTSTKDPQTFQLQAGQTIPAGSVFGVKMNEHGKLALCAANEVSKENSVPAATDNAFRGQLPAANVARGAINSAINGNMHGARSLTSGRPSTATSTTLQSQTDTSTSATSPHYASMPVAQSDEQDADDRLGMQSAYMSDLTLRQYAVQSPGLMSNNTQQYVAHSNMQYPGEQTPTHRPAAHGAHANGAHAIGTMNMNPQEGPLSNMSVNLLKAKFHGITSEIFVLQDALLSPNLNDTGISQLKAKFSRALADKQAAEAQLLMAGVTTVQTLSSPRRDSFTSTDGTSSGISPVRAEDGRVLQSASRVGSPPRQTGNFDRAPGGSARQKNGHAYKHSYGDHINKSINDLLDDPDDTPVRARTGHQTSSFQPNMGSAGNTFNFPASVEQHGTVPAVSNNHPSYSFGGAPMQPYNAGTSAQYPYGGQSYGFHSAPLQPYNTGSFGFGNSNGYVQQPGNSGNTGNGQLSYGFNGTPSDPNNAGTSSSSSFPAPLGSTQRPHGGERFGS